MRSQLSYISTYMYYSILIHSWSLSQLSQDKVRVQVGPLEVANKERQTTSHSHIHTYTHN